MRPATGDRPPLFCFHPAGGLGWPYAALLRRLDPSRPLYALQARGLDGRDWHPASVQAMVDDYLAEVSAVRPDGPYHLLGWSFGGLVAHAVATELQARGAEVRTLTMLDSHLTVVATGGGPHLSEEQQALLILLGLAGVGVPSAGPDDLGPGGLRLLLRTSGQAPQPGPAGGLRGALPREHRAYGNLPSRRFRGRPPALRRGGRRRGGPVGRLPVGPVRVGPDRGPRDRLRPPQHAAAPHWP